MTDKHFAFPFKQDPDAYVKYLFWKSGNIILKYSSIQIISHILEREYQSIYFKTHLFKDQLL